jgi:hypothetical protein
MRDDACRQMINCWLRPPIPYPRCEVAPPEIDRARCAKNYRVLLELKLSMASWDPTVRDGKVIGCVV